MPVKGTKYWFEITAFEAWRAVAFNCNVTRQQAIVLINSSKESMYLNDTVCQTV